MKDKELLQQKKQFAEEAMKRRPDAVPIDKIVYLDEDFHTFKYFMTGNYDEEARRRDIDAHNAEAKRLAAERSDSSAERSVEAEEAPQQSAFFHKLQTLNDKISVFKD